MAWARRTPSRTRTPSLSRRLLATAVLGTVSALALSGCSLGGWVYNADLPGGAKLGSHPLTLTADFADVLDLVPESSVKVDDVAVGRVTRIQLEPDGHSARVTLKVNRDADLVTGTTARLEQSSLLGEKYVALVPPGASTGSASVASTGSASVASTGSANVNAAQPLASGAHLPLSSTSAAVDVEQVLGSLSLVLNGGGIAQFKEISEELQKVSDGRTGQIRDFLTQINRFVSTLDQRKDAITGALDGLDHLSKALNSDDDKIANALDGLSPGMKVLAQQEPQLVQMLQALNKLSDVTVSTLDKSQKDMVADLKTLDPILTQLAKSGTDLPNALQILLTYPFPDSVQDAIKGDYFNAFMTTNFRTTPNDCSGIGCAWPQVAGRVAAQASSGPLTAFAAQLATASASASPSTSTAASPSASGTGSSSASPTTLASLLGSPSASGTGSDPSAASDSPTASGAASAAGVASDSADHADGSATGQTSPTASSSKESDR